MAQKRITYRFNNPNTPELTAEYLARIFVESNADKVADAISDASCIDESPVEPGKHKVLC